MELYFSSTLHAFMGWTATDWPLYVLITELLWVVHITVCYLWSHSATVCQNDTSLCSSKNLENLKEMFGCYATRKQRRNCTSAISPTRIEADMAERSSVNTIQAGKTEEAGRVRGLKPGHLTGGVTEFPKLHSSTAVICFFQQGTLQLKQSNVYILRNWHQPHVTEFSLTVWLYPPLKQEIRLT
jgi:hypothetical protein